jgi:hypothetical protein
MTKLMIQAISYDRLFGLRIGILSFVLCLLPAMLFSWEPAPKEIQDTARNGLPEFIRSLPEDNVKSYGFSTKSQAVRTTLRDGIRVYTIKPNDLFRYKKGMDVTRMITPTGMWLFPVLEGGRSKSLLTVDRLHGKWEAVAFGGSGLASQLEAIELKWPSSSGYELTFVRVFQAKSDFVFIEKGKTVMIKPLESAVIGLQLHGSAGRYGNGVYDPFEILPRMISVVRRSLQAK